MIFKQVCVYVRVCIKLELYIHDDINNTNTGKLKPAHLPSEYSVCQWFGRSRFNPKSGHTKHFKNGT